VTAFRTFFDESAAYLSLCAIGTLRRRQSAKRPRLCEAARPSIDPRRQSCCFSGVEAIMPMAERSVSRRHLSAKNVAVSSAVGGLSA
jgi:hypothetical protein